MLKCSMTRLAAWLALVAMMFVVFAPLVSVSLLLSSGLSVPLSHYDMAVADHYVNCEAVSVKQTPRQIVSAGQQRDVLPGHAGFCGYCVLLIHLPALLLSCAILAVGIRWLRSVRSVPAVASLWLFIPWFCPHPRAPPCCCAFSS